MAEVSTRQAVASYEKSIQTAFKEVADTLGAQADYQQQLQAQQALVEANQTYFKLAEVRYEKGWTAISPDSMPSARCSVPNRG